MFHIEVVKVNKEAIIHSVSYDEMSYEGKCFEEIYNKLTGRLGMLLEKSIA